MKIKLILLFILVSILISISFFQVKNEKINYTVIGDKQEFTSNLKSLNYIDLLKEDISNKNKLNEYSKEFIFSDIRTTDLFYKIEKNETLNGKTIQFVLKNTDLLLLNIGNNELNYKLQNLNKYSEEDNDIYNYLDEVIKDINKLIDLITKYSDSKILFIGYYNNTNIFNNDKFYSYINKELQKNKKIIFIDVFDILKTKNSNYYLDYNENMAIYNEIITKITCKKIY